MKETGITLFIGSLIVSGITALISYVISTTIVKLYRNKEPFELFIDEITEWEDFDDDKVSVHKIGFNHVSGVKKEGE